ncbi:MAG TPA: sugar phosphate isomerase/epimerase family protein [Terriglobia bacterium]|nr:sugar phosphate isomerase/epimerase family protein [Terriglobia bacterium]
MGKQLSRRTFLQVSSAATLATARVLAASPVPVPPVPGPFRGTLCLYSKPVPQLTWQELAQSAKRAGFEGIDLTVRRGGHVMPQRVAEDLPKAVGAIRAEGLDVPMITTELVSADDPTAAPILSTAAKMSIPLLKPGYYHYKFVDVRKELEEAGKQFRGLAELAGRYGVQVGFHNHAGYIGCQIWDIARVMDTLDPKWAGYYYDLENAAEEGGLEGWRIAANLVMPRMKMMAAKDFYWKKTETKGWQATTCPLGEGMCKHRDFLRMAAAVGFHGPISLHIEYQIPGVSDEQGIALSRENDGEVMAAAQRDLETLKSLLHGAYEGA